MDDRENWIAAGRRVVGEEDHRLPARRHLDGTEHHPLARQLVLADPHGWLALEAEADPVGRLPHRVRRGAEPVERVGGEPVRARPGRDPQRARQGRSRRVQRRGRAHRRTDRERRAVLDARRTHPGQGVGRPRAEHGRDVDTTGDRDVGPHPRARRPEPEPATGGQPLGPVDAALDAVHLDRRRRPGQRHPDSGVGGQLEPAPGHLEERVVGTVADQPVGERRGRPVQRTGPGHAEVGEAGAAPVLDGGERTGARDGQRHAGTNLTLVPGASRAGSLRSGSQRERSVWPSSRQPPGDSDG